jgi:hypothetical protein
MMESHIDYAMESSIRHVAERLQIDCYSATSSRSLKDLLSVIERRCPDVAEILLEYTFEKDELRKYLEFAPPISTLSNVGIVGTRNPKSEEHWRALFKSYPRLLEAINKCSGA